MILCVVALVLLAGVLALQAFQLRTDRMILDELRAIAAAAQEIRNRRP